MMHHLDDEKNPSFNREKLISELFSSSFFHVFLYKWGKYFPLEKHFSNSTAKWTLHRNQISIRFISIVACFFDTFCVLLVELVFILEHVFGGTFTKNNILSERKTARKLSLSKGYETTPSSVRLNHYVYSRVYFHLHLMVSVKYCTFWYIR